MLRTGNPSWKKASGEAVRPSSPGRKRAESYYEWLIIAITLIALLSVKEVESLTNLPKPLAALKKILLVTTSAS